MKIWVREPHAFPGPALDRLRAHGEVVLGEDADTADADAMFVRLAHRIDRAFLQSHPAIKWIVSPTTGLNHIDQVACAEFDVAILSLKGQTDFLDTIRATAEHTLALALALLRGLPRAVGAVQAGHWDRYPHKGRELAGKSVFVWGYGRIGRQVTALYEAFGSRVVANDCVPGRVPADNFVTVSEGLEQCDLFSLHLPLEPGTEGIVDGPMLAKLPSHAVLINTARGELIDQNALFAMLREGRLAGAALDVLQDEPSPLSPAVTAALAAVPERLIVTPHIAGYTHESLNAVETHMVDWFLSKLG